MVFSQNYNWNKIEIWILCVVLFELGRGYFVGYCPKVNKLYKNILGLVPRKKEGNLPPSRGCRDSIKILTLH